MRTRLWRGCLGVLALALTTASGQAQQASVPAAAAFRWAKVTYISGESIYLDAGTTHGVRERTLVEFRIRDSVVAQVDVQFVSSTRSSGRLRPGGLVAIGDSGRFIPAADAAVSGGGPDSALRTAPAATRRTSGARTTTARVGIRYMQLQTGSSSAGRLSQPALDLRLETHRLRGSAIGWTVDARAHRQRSGNGRTDGSTRVYQSNIEWQTAGASPTRVSMGRQFSTVLSPLGYFDGLSVDADHRHWRVGVLAGTQPNATSFMPASEIRETGAWIQWHNAPGTTGLFQTTVGGVGSYGASGVNREFALVNTVMVTPTFSLYATQEIDVNRSWKKSAENGKSLTWSSTFVTARVAPTRAVSFNAGYDSRRMVRLYRDFLTPDVAFDDAFRRGYFGGLSVSVPHLYLNADTRVSDGVTVGRNTSHTASLSLSQLTPLRLGIRARATQYNGPTVAGRLLSGALEISPRGVVRLEANVGQREDTRAAAGFGLARTTWVGVDADAGIGRSWYLMLSHYQEIGNVDRVLQQYVGLSWRY